MIDKNIKLLTDFFLKPLFALPHKNKISLFGGCGGYMLVQVLHLKYNNDRHLKKLLDENFQALIAAIEAGDIDNYVTFGNGLAGFGWLIIYMKDLGLIDIEDAFFCDLDIYLLEKMKMMLSTHNWDLINGGLGIALYFLKRGLFNQVDLAVDYLYQNKITGKGEIKWTRLENLDKNEYRFDFGLAHGNVGILHFLTKCYENGVQADRCLEMVKGNFRFYHNNQQNIDTVGSYFPNYHIYGNSYSSDSDQKSRIAWCYGDLSILYKLLQISALLPVEPADDYLAMLLVTAERCDFESTKISDPYLCHGSAGVALIYKNLFIATKIVRFEESYRYWKIKTMKLFLELAAMGFPDEQHLNQYLDTSPPDLLDGNSGLAIFYINELLEEQGSSEHWSAWKEILFL